MDADDMADDYQAKIRELENRLRDIDRWKVEIEKAAAVDAVERRHIDERFDRVDSELRDIKGLFSKGSGVLVVAVLSAFAMWVIDGGMSIGP